MALTRDFKETAMARVQRDRKFREALFSEAINACLAGDTATGEAMLRDLVNAAVGFERLAAEIQKPSKSLHRRLAPRGNPNTENFFGILSALQKRTKVRLQVSSEWASPVVAGAVAIAACSNMAPTVGDLMKFSIECEREDDGRWLAEVLELPGVMAYGNTAEEAQARVQVVALRVLAERLEHGESRRIDISISVTTS